MEWRKGDKRVCLMMSLIKRCQRTKVNTDIYLFFKIDYYFLA